MDTQVDATRVIAVLREELSRAHYELAIARAQLATVSGEVESDG